MIGLNSHLNALLHTSSPFSYVPRDYYEANPELKKAIDMIHSGHFSPEQPDLFHDLTYQLLNHDR